MNRTNTLSFMAICLVVGAGVFAIAELNLEAGEGTQSVFEAKYKKWEKYVSRPQITLHSRATTQFECKEFKEIVELGLPAIPFIIKKMEKNTQNFRFAYTGSSYFWYYPVYSASIRTGSAVFNGEK